MVDLISKSACDGLLPRNIGTVTLAEVLPDQIWLVAAFKGQDKSVSDRLKTSHGVGLPAANRALTKGDIRAQWCGLGQALIFGVRPDLDGIAQVVDQSDSFAIVKLTGADGVAVLARLVPIDLRPSVFKPGHSARTLLGHMTCAITRTGSDEIEVMVMRSMAATLVHELDRAARGVAGRKGLG